MKPIVNRNANEVLYSINNILQLFIQQVQSVVVPETPEFE